jgi:hypothetical protein
VVIAFMLWGGFSVGVQFQKEGRVAGNVFGKDVSFQEFDSFYRANQIFSYSEKKPESAEVLKQQTWQSIIFAREAKRRKMEVTDDEVRKEILRLLEQQKIENPTPQVYEAWLKSALRESPQEFEKQIRELLRIQKLLKEINNAPTGKTPPSAEEAKKRFTLEKNELSAEYLKFTTAEEAKKFRDGIKSPEDWKKQTEQMEGAVETSGMAPLSAWINQLKVPEEKAFELHKLGKDKISDPVPMGESFAVLHILDRRFADEENYEKEHKEKFMNDLVEQQKYERFVTWTLDLLKQADLKDYLPKNESAPSQS